jgi:hypothetical protein
MRWWVGEYSQVREVEQPITECLHDIRKCGPKAKAAALQLKSVHLIRTMVSQLLLIFDYNKATHSRPLD